MILLPKYKDLYTNKPINMGMVYKGEIKITMRDANGKYLYETDWLPNVITDVGLDNVAIHGSSMWQNCYLGSGNTPAAFTDTALATYMGQANGSGAPATTTGSNGAPNYEVYEIRGYRANAGVATGTIQEIGFGNINTNLSVRSIISPGIVKANDQIMDITHKRWFWRDLVTSDLTGTLDISGVTYDWILRAAEVAVGYAEGFASAGNFSNTYFCYGELKAASVTGGASVIKTSYIYRNGGVTAAYTPGSYTRNNTTYLGIDNGNHVSGIRTVEWTDGCQNILDFALGAFMRNPGFACSFYSQADGGIGGGGSAIMKTSDETFNISATRSWRRT